MADPPNELKAALAEGRALLVCGAGVSMAATGGAAPGWKGLIEAGLERAEAGLERAVALHAASGESWAEACRTYLLDKNADEWLYAADRVQEKLGGYDGAEYRGFFSEALSTLVNAKPALLTAIRKLADLGNPIATTNYDHLISATFGRDRVDWLNHAGVIEALRGKRKSVWHIHGDYDHPPSIIFSRNDYHRIGEHEFSQFVQQLASLNFTFVFIGCSGSGLADSNVGALLKWWRKGFAGLGDKHFALTTDDNKDPWPAGVIPVRFGARGDLAAYLENLAPVLRAAVSFPPDPKMIGREDRLKELVEAILTQERPICVPGALGMGKTTLALAAAYDPEVVKHFGRNRRFFVNLEPVPDADGVVRALASSLGLDASAAIAGLEQAVTDVCAARSALVILDNVETPWARERAATEAALGGLAGIAGLHLIVTVRGEAPLVPGGGVMLGDVESLGFDEARRLFLRNAGPKHSSDPALPSLLQALDGHPLSIELLAANAAGKADLTHLAVDWEKRRAAMLERGGGDTRLTSLLVSLQISMEALGAKGPAHRLVRAMALLPAGTAESDCEATLSEGAPTEAEKAAAAKLEKSRLVTRRDGRWHLLAPVRGALLQAYPPDATDKARLVQLFLARAALGMRIGTGGWDEVRESVIAEAGNFDAVIAIASGVATPPDGLVAAVEGLAEFHSYTGLASVVSLGNVVESLRKSGNVLGEAHCVSSVGDIALRRFDHNSARARFEAALPLYRKVGSASGQANCIFRLAKVALACSDLETARAQFEAALPFYRKVGNVVGEANCIQGLGDIALARSDHGTAGAQFGAALQLYHKVGAVLGQANCTRRLGAIALKRSDHEAARPHFEAALALFSKVGSVQGEANCISGLGEIAFRRSDDNAARARYETALPLYRKVGDMLGEASCIKRLGDIAERTGDIAAALRGWNEALALYGRIPEPYSIGTAHLRIARRAATPAEAKAHREAARRAWASIGRADLIGIYLDGTPKAPLHID